MSAREASRIDKIEESSTLKMAKLTRELISQGHNIVNLTLGEPDFDTPEHIQAAATEAMKEGYTHYPPVAGYPELREAIANKFKLENDLHYSPSQVLVSTGAKQSIINVLMSLIDEGDEVLIPSPYWVSYPEMVKIAEGKPVFIHAPVENDYKITPAQLEEAITPKTKAFVYSSPSNPTGSCYTREELFALAEVFARHPNVYIISDEIYEHIRYTGHHASLAHFPEIHDRVIVINGVSKAFAMTGWRIGYLAAGSEWITKACEKIQGQFTSGANSIAQRATITALTSDLGPTNKMCETFSVRRQLVLNKLKSIPGIKYNEPDGAFYFFPDVSSYFGKKYNGRVIENDEDLVMYLLEEAKVALVSGRGFGNANCLRFSFAAKTDLLEEGLNRLSNAFAQLK